MKKIKLYKNHSLPRWGMGTALAVDEVPEKASHPSAFRQAMDTTPLAPTAHSRRLNLLVYHKNPPSRQEPVKVEKIHINRSVLKLILKPQENNEKSLGKLKFQGFTSGSEGRSLTAVSKVCAPPMSEHKVHIRMLCNTFAFCCRAAQFHV